MNDSFEVERSEPRPGEADIRLRGHLTIAAGEPAWRRLLAAFAGPGRVRVDLSALELVDGAGAAWLAEARQQAVTAGADVAMTGARPSVERMLELYACPDDDGGCLRPAPAVPDFFEQIGAATLGTWRALRETLGWIGDLSVSLLRAVRRPWTVQWSAIPRLMERAGADGVPIVVLIDFLVGLIVGLQAADQLRRFGANIFVADLVGLSMVRELGPLMTSIIVAGRSGAAYAAELGTMKVSEEIDALRSLGLDPQRYLVLPRVLALALVAPILTVLGDVVGILGGLIAAITTLGLTPIAYWNELERALMPLDFTESLVKSTAFAVMITLVACQRGLATRGGASGVGSSTTSAVVTILFWLVAMDAVLSSFFQSQR